MGLENLSGGGEDILNRGSGSFLNRLFSWLKSLFVSCHRHQPECE
jgi:hypothetical protein